MKWKTPSWIVVPMKDIDSANALVDFLNRALKIGDMGGDLELAVLDGKR